MGEPSLLSMDCMHIGMEPFSEDKRTSVKLDRGFQCNFQ